MSKFFLLLFVGLVTQVGAVEPSQSAPLCSPEHRAWFETTHGNSRMYNAICENIRRLNEIESTCHHRGHREECAERIQLDRQRAEADFAMMIRIKQGRQ